MAHNLNYCLMQRRSEFTDFWLIEHCIALSSLLKELYIRILILCKKYLYIQLYIYTPYILIIMQWCMLIPMLLQSIYYLFDRYVLHYVEWKINFFYMTFMLIKLPGHFFSLARHILLFIKNMTAPFWIGVIWLARMEGAFPPAIKICTENDVTMDMLSYHHCAVK